MLQHVDDAAKAFDILSGPIEEQGDYSRSEELDPCSPYGTGQVAADAAARAKWRRFPEYENCASEVDSSDISSCCEPYY